jgi:6-phosphofructokinase 2
MLLTKIAAATKLPPHYEIILFRLACIMRAREDEESILTMIYTVTPNPALDICGVVHKLIPNEKNYVRSETRSAGGNAVNVARLLTKFAIPTHATGFLGGGVGREIKTLLDAEGVMHHFVEIEEDTRVNVTVTNAGTHEQTRLSFGGPRIKLRHIHSLEQRLTVPRSSFLVLGGSFPPGFTVFHATRLIRRAQEKQIPVIVDCPGRILQRLRLDGLLLIKPNLVEFQELIGRKVVALSSIARAAQELAKKVRFVCVSSVHGGALLASRGSVWFGSPPPIKLRSTVGAGDSMVAAMTAELWRRWANKHFSDAADEQLMPQLLRQGLAAAAATLSAPGTKLGSVREIRKHLSGVTIRRLDP